MRNPRGIAAVSGQPSAVSSQQSAVSGQPSAFSGQWSAWHRLLACELTHKLFG
ncbi:hypothetical protein [Moorena producens]|uniref:hypothetical protein n=1 Tax=Moorena producens TaxID=1155739 RepID=UPI003C77714D